MNEFREWLSDNLRYFMLGGAIILMLLLIFFGIRFVSTLITEPSDDQIQTEQDSTLITPTPEDVVPTPDDTPVVSDKLEHNAVPEVFTLIGTYYNALASKDVETIRGLVDNLPAEDEATIASLPVEAYSNINVYTKANTSGAYVTFVTYDYKLTGIGTLVPSMSQLYIMPAADGSLYICTATPDAETQTFIDETVKSTEVQTIVAQIQAEYDAALASDPALNAYFNPESVPADTTPESQTETPTDEPQTAETPTEAPGDTPAETPQPEEPAPTPVPTPEPVPVVLKQSAFFRDAPNMDSNIFRTIPAGTEMLKLGEGDGWFHVRIDGQDGYIAKRFF